MTRVTMTPRWQSRFTSPKHICRDANQSFSSLLLLMCRQTRADIRESPQRWKRKIRANRKEQFGESLAIHEEECFSNKTAPSILRSTRKGTTFLNQEQNPVKRSLQRTKKHSWKLKPWEQKFGGKKKLTELENTEHRGKDKQKDN